MGFVSVEAARAIAETDVPYIVNRGRKGGSNVAAAICNALIYGLARIGSDIFLEIKHIEGVVKIQPILGIVQIHINNS